MKGPTTIHLLMRFSDKLGFISDTIQAHSDVIRKCGFTWYGKMGKTLAGIKVSQINEQCKRKIPTYLYLVQRSGGRYQIYRGNILKVARALPKGQERYVPKYYDTSGIGEYIRLWLRLSSIKRIPSSELTHYVVSSSGMPVLVTLGRSMAALFVVRLKSTSDDEPKLKLDLEQRGQDSDWDF